MTSPAYQVRDQQYGYHRPTNDAVSGNHDACRRQCRALADWLDLNLPQCRETSLAHTKLEEVMFWANAAIARQQHGGQLDGANSL